MRTIPFPGEVEHSLIFTKDLSSLPRTPPGLRFQMADPPAHQEARARRLILRAFLENPEARDRDIIVFPLGRVPFGTGYTPFVARLVTGGGVDLRGDHVPEPAVPPPPMRILVPGVTRIRFEAAVVLERYTYRNGMAAEVEWEFFCSLGSQGGPNPRGRIGVLLP